MIAMTPKMQAWCVVLSFDDGRQTVSYVLGPSAEGAAAAAAWTVAGGGDVPREAALAGVMVTPIPTEWMRRTLRQLEGGSPIGVVVPMTPKEPSLQQADHDWTSPSMGLPICRRCGIAHSVMNQFAPCPGTPQPQGAA